MEEYNNFFIWVLIPRKWWNPKEWVRARDFQRNFHIVGIMNKEDLSMIKKEKPHD